MAWVVYTVNSVGLQELMEKELMEWDLSDLLFLGQAAQAQEHLGIAVLVLGSLEIQEIPLRLQVEIPLCLQVEIPLRLQGEIPLDTAVHLEEILGTAVRLEGTAVRLEETAVLALVLGILLGMAVQDLPMDYSNSDLVIGFAARQHWFVLIWHQSG